MKVFAYPVDTFEFCWQHSSRTMPRCRSLLIVLCGFPGILLCGTAVGATWPSIRGSHFPHSVGLRQLGVGFETEQQPAQSLLPQWAAPLPDPTQPNGGLSLVTGARHSLVFKARPCNSSTLVSVHLDVNLKKCRRCLLGCLAMCCESAAKPHLCIALW